MSLQAESVELDDKLTPVRVHAQPDGSPSRRPDLHVDTHGDDGDGEEYGCDPNSMFARFCEPHWFLAALCGFVLVQSCVVSGLVSSNISSIETRYAFSSQQAGLIVSSYDIAVLIVISGVAYLGGRPGASKPRWLACGCALLSIGTFTMAIPHFASDKYQVDGATLSDVCGADLITVECDAEPSGLLYLFIFALVIVGIGASPLYTLGPAHMDSLVHSSQIGMYLGIFYAVSALGPAIGYILGGALLSTWVDGSDDEPFGITEDDAKYVGAWWISFVLFACLGGIASVPLFFFKRGMPGTKARKRGEVTEGELEAPQSEGSDAGLEAPVSPKRVSSDEAEEEPVGQERLPQPGPTDIISSLKAVLLNPVFICNCLATASESFAVGGFSTFLPKFVETQFGIRAGAAALQVGLVVIPGGVGGMAVGGGSVSKFKLSPGNMAKFAAVIAGIALVFQFGFLLGCDNDPIVGVFNPYNGESEITGIDSACNAGCLCAESPFEPVCGADGLVYFSPCYAGCTTQTNETLFSSDEDKQFLDCACIANSTGPLPNGAIARGGLCSGGCSKYAPFMVLLFFIMLFTFMNNVPATTVALKCLAPEYRSFGLGVQSVIYRLLGTIPGPIVFGSVFDARCTRYEDKCPGEKGICLAYDNEGLRSSLLGLAFGCKLASLTFFTLSWYFFRNKPRYHQSE